MQTNSTTIIDNSPKSHYIKDSRGNLYLRKLVKLIVYIDEKLQRQVIPRFTTFRCLPDGSVLPRIRLSKKARLKLKLALREEPLPCPSSSPSSKSSSALAPSMSPASA